MTNSGLIGILVPLLVTHEFNFQTIFFIKRHINDEFNLHVQSKLSIEYPKWHHWCTNTFQNCEICKEIQAK